MRNITGYLGDLYSSPPTENSVNIMWDLFEELWGKDFDDTQYYKDNAYIGKDSLVWWFTGNFNDEWAFKNGNY